MSWSVTVKEDFKQKLTYLFCMREIFEKVKGIPKNLKYEVVNNLWDLRTWLGDVISGIHRTIYLSILCSWRL